MPFADGAFDMAVSNGVLNLVPDKDRAFREIHRVLRPGGAFVAADLLVTESVPPEVLANMDAWST
jgi:ubiquinone/menaquinone biosynthesis C-methylase UbiE